MLRGYASLLHQPALLQIKANNNLLKSVERSGVKSIPSGGVVRRSFTKGLMFLSPFSLHYTNFVLTVLKILIFVLQM